MVLILIISVVLMLSGSVYKKLEGLNITEPLLALLFGIFIGPQILDLVSFSTPEEELKLFKKALEFTMAIALMATALRIPVDFIKRNLRSQLLVVGLGILGMFLASAAIVYFLTGLSLLASFLLGAIITPTDPVVASTIVSGDKAEKYLPSRLRHTISFESGVNDGLVFPIIILLIGLFPTEDKNFIQWLLNDLLYANILVIIVALFTGWCFGKLMHHTHKKGYMTPKAILPFSVALAFALFSGLELLNMNGIFGVFIGGLAFSRQISKNEIIEEEQVQESMDRLFTIPVFVIFGIILPWADWAAFGGIAIALILAILIFRRLPAFLLFLKLAPLFKNLRDKLILGWFGPIGVAALFYAIHAKEKTGVNDFWIYTSLIVAASTLVHGFSSKPFSQWYYRKNKK